MQIKGPSTDKAGDSAAPRSALRNVGKTAAFIAVLLVVVMLASKALTPANENVNESAGMYLQPEDSIDVVFLGASTVFFGASPVELYQDHGIAAYNMGSGNQSYITSYFYLKEVLSRNPNLQLVVLDARPLTKVTSVTHQEVDITKMPFSLNKIQHIWETARANDDVNFFAELIPLLRYHSRWDSLEEEDLRDSSAGYSRGQGSDRRVFNSNTSRGSKVSYDETNAIDDEYSSSLEDLRSKWKSESVYWIEKIIGLCNENGIDILLVKFPSPSWTDELHDSTNLFAEEYGLPFLDMSSPDVVEDTQLSYENEMFDQLHLNLVGSVKISDYLGDYITENYDLPDRRDDERFAFIEEECKLYYEDVAAAALLQCQNLSEYLDLLGTGDFVAFIATKGESAEGLDDACREKLASLGLNELADI